MKNNNMNAVVHKTYGDPSVLVLTTVEKPTPGKGEILVAIKNTSVTAGDVLIRKGSPIVVRFISGLFKPRNPILGHEYAGIVESTGAGVQTFQAGDRVFGSTGTKSGTYAEYMVVKEDDIIAKLPENISYESAGTIPVGALTALYFLQKGGISKEKNVLIHGASGSVGTAAVQIAKAYGAAVTAVCSGDKKPFVQALGADRVIDNKTEDFSKSAERFDLVFNVAGQTSFKECQAVMKPKAMYVASSAHSSDYGKMFFGKKADRSRIVANLMKESKENLEEIARMIAAGKLKGVVDKLFALNELAAAHRYVEKGKKIGNVSIIVNA
ncbi:MAG: NAD(P)-dependent alcohol dehydrogenase [Saprospiraceae bacterium]|nr:NAD(P)-dependent alcohol dehydrogenase [Saprospiraceae bacterium]